MPVCKSNDGLHRSPQRRGNPCGCPRCGCLVIPGLGAHKGRPYGCVQDPGITPPSRGSRHRLRKVGLMLSSLKESAFETRGCLRRYPVAGLLWTVVPIVACAVLVGQETVYRASKPDATVPYVDPQLCQPCHSDIHDSYRKVAMGRSFYRPSSGERHRGLQCQQPLLPRALQSPLSDGSTRWTVLPDAVPAG